MAQSKATKTKRPNRRETYLINRPFQLRFIAYSLSVALIVSAVFYSVNLLFIWKFTNLGRSLNFAADHSFFRFIQEQKNFIDWSFFLTAIVATTLLVFLALRLSHRIAGPLYRLDRDLRDMAQKKKLRKVKFRDGDFFMELAESANMLINASFETKTSDKDPKAKDT